MPDFFESELLEAKFRDVTFPTSDFQVKIQQSIAQHARADQDGARIESTGRDPLVFSATIPFRNTVTRGRNETWGTLYPDAHRAFLSAMSDRSTGTLVHPSIGPVLVKAVSCSTSLTGSKRDGEDVTAEWIEYSEDEDASNAILSSNSPIGIATINAIDLDSGIDELNLGGFDPDGGLPSFEESMRTITGAIDTASLIARKVFGVIDRVIYRIDAIDFSLREAANPQLWPVRQNIFRLRAAMLDLRARASFESSDVSLYIVPAPTTLANLASRFDNKVSDMLQLNPGLSARPSVTRGTVVRYYSK